MHSVGRRVSAVDSVVSVLCGTGQSVVIDMSSEKIRGWQQYIAIVIKIIVPFDEDRIALLNEQFAFQPTFQSIFMHQHRVLTVDYSITVGVNKQHRAADD